MTNNNEIESDRANSPIFVVGPPRSGTHLMRYCLSQHDRIYIAPETNFFISIFGSRRLIREKDIGKYSAQIVNNLFKSGDPSISEFEPYKSQIASDISNKICSYHELGDYIFSFFSKVKGKARWGEKTPLHLLYLSQIHDYYPNAKIICMRRSIANTVASYVSSSHIKANIPYAIAEIRECWNAFNNSPYNLHIVDYESLTDSPIKVLKDVCNYIGEDFQSEILQPKMRDSSYGEKAMEFNDSIGIEKDDINKWRNKITAQEALTAEAYVTKGIKALFCKGVSRKIVIAGIIKTLMYKLRLKKTKIGLFYWKDFITNAQQPN